MQPEGALRKGHGEHIEKVRSVGGTLKEEERLLKRRRLKTFQYENIRRVNKHKFACSMGVFAKAPESVKSETFLRTFYHSHL